LPATAGWARGWRVSRAARDDRAIDARAPTHSISAETTLALDQADAAALAHILWPLCERVSARLKQAALAAGTVTLKLKTADFRLRTRSRRLADPTQLAETLFSTATALLAGEAGGSTRFRLVGVAADALVYSGAADPPTLFDRDLDRPRQLEHAMDQIRGRLGDDSVRLGRDLRAAGATRTARQRGGEK
jgi:DNA polymerase IV